VRFGRGGRETTFACAGGAWRLELDVLAYATPNSPLEALVAGQWIRPVLPAVPSQKLPRGLAVSAAGTLLAVPGHCVPLAEMRAVGARVELGFVEVGAVSVPAGTRWHGELRVGAHLSPLAVAGSPPKLAAFDVPRGPTPDGAEPTVASV